MNNSLCIPTSIQSCPISNPTIVEPNNVHSSFLWHSCLGHANFNTVRQILKLCNIATPNKVVSFACKSCNLEKAHRIHSPLSTTCVVPHLNLLAPGLDIMRPL